MGVEGATFGILGALKAFPRRLAAREVAKQGGVLRRGITRRTTHVVFSRSLLDRLPGEEIAKRADELGRTGTVLLSENGFRRLLGLMTRADRAALSTRELAEQSRLGAGLLQVLSLFDAFEHDDEPYSFRDVILARKYGKLIEAGTGWDAVARSVNRVGKVASLTAVALHAEGTQAIYARDGDALTEIDGQHRLQFEDMDHDADALFEEAEAAELAGDFAQAAALYAQYLSLDPSDSVAAFNRANALRAAGETQEAAHAFAQALKLDPGFVEAWFNYGTLLAEGGKVDTARRHFTRAIVLDHDYADAVYNLAALEYDAGRLSEARRWWARYVELDPDSKWGRRAARGIQLVDMTLKAEQSHGKIA